MHLSWIDAIFMQDSNDAIFFNKTFLVSFPPLSLTTVFSKYCEWLCWILNKTNFYFSPLFSPPFFFPPLFFPPLVFPSLLFTFLPAPFLPAPFLPAPFLPAPFLYFSLRPFSSSEKMLTFKGTVIVMSSDPLLFKWHIWITTIS